jgi:hypothetical protein
VVGRADSSAGGFSADADDPVALDTDDPGPDDLAGLDVK